MNRFATRVLAVALAFPLIARADLPPAFTNITLDAARKQVEGTDQLVVIKFTAVWCGPCKAMDRTTWRDDKVVEWVKARGLALEVDVDKEPKIAKQFNITAMPTMVMLKGGNEIARTVGYVNAQRMIAWLDKAATGKADAVVRVDRTSKDMQAQVQIARELASKGNADAATDDFVWLWQNIDKVEPSMSGVRVSFLASDMKSLAARHPNAKAAFTALRDQAAKGADAKDPQHASRVDWIVLNGVIDDSAQTLEWFDAVKGSDEGTAAFGRTAYLLEPLFLESGRLADLPSLYADPIASMKLAAELPETYKRTIEARGEQANNDAIASMKEQFRQKWSRVYVGYLSAGRDDTASQLALEFVKFGDPTDARFALLNAAVEHKQVRPVHLEWLKEIEDSGANLSRLRGKVEAALNQK